MKGVTEDFVEFNDVDRDVGVNLVPISAVAHVPRKGDFVYLPGEAGNGHGMYEVVSVTHYYRDDESGESPCPARLLKISVGVKRVIPSALRKLNAGARKYRPLVERQLSRSGRKPSPALVDSAAKYYNTLRKLAKD